MGTDTSSGASAPGKAHLLRGQRLVNTMMSGLLRTPGVARGIGKRLILLDVVGRKTGKHYSVPTAYTDHAGSLLVGTQFGWSRNLHTGEPVEVVYRGTHRTADVQVISDEDGVVEGYRIMCRDNRNFAKFHHIGVDADGEPDPDDLHRSWEAGSRVIRLTLQ